MSPARLSALIGISLMLAAPARAEEAFVTQLRLPARGQSVDAFAWRDGRGVIVETAALARLGVNAPGGERTHLADVPGLAYVELEHDGAILLTCSAACFPVQRLGARAPEAPINASPWGGYLNYDIAADWRDGEAAALGALLDANLFGPLGRGEASWLAHAAHGFTRLETRWTIDAPAHRLRVRLGDSALPSLDGGVVRFGGVQIGRHFALAPRAVTYPTPRLAGEADAASTVELYIDGALHARDAVAAGPFELDDAPLISGAGQAQLVVTDMLGRQQIVTRPFYVSTDLLRPGLTDWSLAAGVVREAFGQDSAAYGDRFAAARYRRGLSNAFTAEIGAMWRDDGLAMHIGLAAAHPSIGLVHIQHARGGDGGATALAWLREARGWSFGLQAHTRDEDFSAFGEIRGARADAAASLNLQLGAYGDLSATAAAATFDHGPDVRTYALAYAPDLARAALNIRLSYIEHARGELAFGVGFSVPLAGDVAASLAGAWDRRGVAYRAGAQSAAPSEGGVGWRVRARGGAQERLDAALSYRGASNEARIAGAWTPESAGLRLELTGAIGWIDEYAFAARPIEGAFALVDVGAGDVGVSRDRLRLGRSDAQGRFLAPHLRAYDANVIAIDAEDLPFDRAPSVVAQRVSPAEGAGVIVRFTDVRQAIVETAARFADGAPAPRGAVLIRSRDGARFPVGGEGRVVVRGAAENDVVRLESDMRCAARADADAAQAGLILTCASAA